MTETTSQTEDFQQKIQTKDTGFRIFGYIILIITFGIFGVWSFVAPLDSAAYGIGSVVVKGYSKTVQHLDGGIVNKIYVKDGDEVKAGDLLIKLDDTQARAQQEMIRGQLLTSSALEARLIAEQKNLQAVYYPDFLVNSEDSRVKEIIGGQNEIFKTRKQSISGETDVLKQRIQQLKSKLKGLVEQQKSKTKLKVLYRDEIKEMRLLLDEGFIDKLRLRELERKLTELDANIAAITSEQAATEIQIGEAEIQIIQLVNRLQEEVALELGKVQTQMLDLKERQIALDDLVKRTSIFSPVSGFVVGMTVHTEGGVVTPGNPILQIVPETDDLIIKARISPQDIDRMKLGLNAEIRFPSFKQGTTPTLYGQVIHLSADSLLDEKTGESYYEAKLEVSEKSKKDLKSLQLLPGMPAEVLIATGERTLWQYLVQPITDAYSRSLIED